MNEEKKQALRRAMARALEPEIFDERGQPYAAHVVRKGDGILRDALESNAGMAVERPDAAAIIGGAS